MYGPHIWNDNEHECMKNLMNFRTKREFEAAVCIVSILDELLSN